MDGADREGLQGEGTARDELIAAISHELRTPITSITGYAAALLRQWEGMADDERRALVERILANGRELGALVDTMLSLAAGDFGRLHVELRPVALADATREAIDAARPLLGERELTTDLKALDGLADPALVHRVLIAMIETAGRHAGRDARFSVSLAPGEDDTTVELTVRASGSGGRLPVEGLEMALARQHAARMGGILSLTVADDGAMVASLMLPAAEPTYRNTASR